MKKIMFFLMGLGLVSSTHANIADLLPEAKLKEAKSSLHTVYVGAGISKRLVHTNAEIVTPYGIAYGKVGAFTNEGNEIGVQAGLRYPVHFTGTDQNGYYVGVFGGHIENRPLNNGVKQRLGAGVDLSFVMLNQQRISTFSVGVMAGERLKDNNGVVVSSAPTLQIGYSLSFGVF